MKKILSLLLCITMIISVVCIVPFTASAQTLSMELIPEDVADEYWPLKGLADGIIKIGDWYYEYDKLSGIDIKLRSVCGYDGNETDITVPILADGQSITKMSQFYILSNTVETLRIPKEITSIISWFRRNYYNESGPIIECQNGSKLKEIIVDSENPYYSSVDGILYSKSGEVLYTYPIAKADEQFRTPENVKYIECCAFKGVTKLKSLTITRKVRSLGYDSLPQSGLEELYIENAILPAKVPDTTDSGYEIPLYYPEVPGGTIYCVENSPMYEYYAEYGVAPLFYKELKTLPAFPDELVKEDDGKWYYYHNGLQVTDYYKYYKDIMNTLAKYNGKWFYIENGIWNKEATTLFEYQGKWFYIKNGKWDKTATDIVWFSGKWFYVKNGKWTTANNTLFKKNGKWFAIKDGKWYKDKAIITYNGKKFYVNKGFAQLGFSGKVKIDGKTYKIKGGKVV